MPRWQGKGAAVPVYLKGPHLVYHAPGAWAVGALGAETPASLGLPQEEGTREVLAPFRGPKPAPLQAPSSGVDQEVL